VGDFWAYRTNTSFTEGFVLDGTATFRLDAREDVAVEGVGYDAFRVAITGAGRIDGEVRLDGGSVPVSGTWDLVGEEILEASGLKIVSSLLELTAEGVTQPFDQPFTLRVRNLTTFSILQDAWRFPVDVGDEGFVRSRFNATEDITFRYSIFENSSASNGTGERTVLYRVDGTSTVTTAAGTFAAYAIRETWPDGRVDILHLAPAAGNNARTESYNETGAPVARTELAAYRYQALEPPRFLGLTLESWAVAGAGAAAAAAGIAWSVIRRRRRARAPPLVPPSQ
jgi:hypothetical protein